MKALQPYRDDKTSKDVILEREIMIVYCVCLCSVLWRKCNCSCHGDECDGKFNNGMWCCVICSFRLLSSGEYFNAIRNQCVDVYSRGRIIGCCQFYLLSVASCLVFDELWYAPITLTIDDVIFAHGIHAVM